jgi:hypothetical protein
MLYVNIVLFALAAVLGIIILRSLLTTGTTPKGVVYTHGLFAAAGLIVLILNVLRHPGNSLRTSLILFVIAALGGFVMFFRDQQKKKIPVPLAVVHALVAVGGFIVLLLFVL